MASWPRAEMVPGRTVRTVNRRIALTTGQRTGARRPTRRGPARRCAVVQEVAPDRAPGVALGSVAEVSRDKRSRRPTSAAPPPQTPAAPPAGAAPPAAPASGPTGGRRHRPVRPHRPVPGARGRSRRRRRPLAGAGVRGRGRADHGHRLPRGPRRRRRHRRAAPAGRHGAQPGPAAPRPTTAWAAGSATWCRTPRASGPSRSRRGTTPTAPGSTTPSSRWPPTSTPS